MHHSVHPLRNSHLFFQSPFPWFYFMMKYAFGVIDHVLVYIGHNNTFVSDSTFALCLLVGESTGCNFCWIIIQQLGIWSILLLIGEYPENKIASSSRCCISKGKIVDEIFNIFYFLLYIWIYFSARSICVVCRVVGIFLWAS